MDYTDILTNIRRIVRSVNLESKRIEKEYGISIPQLLCLSFLKTRLNFQASHKEIKDFLNLNASTVTGIISRLEKKGLVARLPRQHDKRVGLISLTAKGSDLLGKTPAPLHQQLATKLKSLSPEQLSEMSRAFQLITDFLHIDDMNAAPIIAAGPEMLEGES